MSASPVVKGVEIPIQASGNVLVHEIAIRVETLVRAEDQEFRLVHAKRIRELKGLTDLALRARGADLPRGSANHPDGLSPERR